MAGDAWAFLLDENVSRDVEKELGERGYSATHVVDALAPGVDDVPDILPYAREHDLVIVTKDYSDFGALDAADHDGVVLIANHRHTPRDMARGIDQLVAAYETREAFRGRREFLDDWIPAE